MYIILLILFVNYLVSADDFSKETKYIDLLPEKEKEEFLERIARRIFNQVQSKDDRDRLSGEVSDTQLDEHDALIKKILEEESLNLRKNDNHDSNKDDKSINKNEKVQDILDDADHIDLTLHAGRRNKRNNDEISNANSKIVYVSGERNIRDPENNDSKRDKNESDVEDIQIKHFRRNKDENGNELEITTQKNDIQITQIVDFDTEEAKVNFQDFQADTTNNNSKKSTQSREIDRDKINNKNLEKDSIEDISKYHSQSGKTIGGENTDNKFGSTQKIYESFKEYSEENDAVTKSVVSTTTIEPDVKPKEVTTEKLKINDTKTESNKKATNLQFQRSYTKDATLDARSKPDTLLNDVNNKSISRDNVKNIKINKPNKENIEDNIKAEYTTTKIEVLTTDTLRTEAKLNNVEEIVGHTLYTIIPFKHNVEDKESGKSKTTNNEPEKVITDINGKNLYTVDTSISEDDKKIRDAENAKTNNSDEVITGNNKTQDASDKIYSLANDLIYVLRTRLDAEASSNENNLNGLQANEHMNPKEYKVYEVPAGQKPFITNSTDKDNKENPYYVPIYNYSPNNAYYDPHNRLGPNADDETYNINENNERDDNTDMGRSEKDNTHIGDEDTVNENIDEKNQDPNKYSKFDSLLRSYIDHEKHHKLRFGTTKSNANKKIPYQLDLPVYPKFADIIQNSNDYLDIDYIYGRTDTDVPPKRSSYEIKKEKAEPVFPDSHESDQPFNTMNLKNHMSAVRQLLYSQKHYSSLAKPKKHTEYILLYEHKLDNKEDKTKSRKMRETLIEQIGGNVKYYIDKALKAIKAFKDALDENKPSKYQISNDLDTLQKPKRKQKFLKKIPYLHKKKSQMKEKATHPKKQLQKPKQEYLKKIPYILYRHKKKSPTKGKATHPKNHNRKPVTEKPKESLRNLKFNFTKWHGSFPFLNFSSPLPTFYDILNYTISRDENFRNLAITTGDRFYEYNFTRSGFEVDSESFVSVLEDMVEDSARGLRQYDWLGTTVDIQAALLKLLDITDALQNGATLSKPDLQLFKYILYLHTFSKSKKENNPRRFLMPTSKGRAPNSGLRTKNWILRMLVDVTMNKKIVPEDLNDLSEFLNALQYYLYDLHTAITEIATITTYKSQRWIENLKELYLDTTKKHLLEVLLHLSTSRLLDLVENSAKEGLEDDFLMYALKNGETMQRTKGEMIFVLNIIEELKKIPYQKSYSNLSNPEYTK